MKPPIKWAGGKSWAVDIVGELWRSHSHRRWVDPFCGALALPLALQPQKALLNDVNHLSINFWRWVQKNGIATLDMKNDSDYYYRVRDILNDSLTPSHVKAEAFYYVNRTCYNGLTRLNAAGGFNVPFGKYKTINYQNDFSEYREAIAGWEFQQLDFRQLDILDDDFIYADPPYHGTFTGYSGKFEWADQVDLATLLANHPGPVVASNSATPEIILLYSDLGFDLDTVEVPRKISCKGDRAPAEEIIAMRNL